GYYTDNETGYIYCTFRYYDPSVGRWLSRDPIGLDGGQQNLYAYCGGDPVNEIDPIGLTIIPSGDNDFQKNFALFLKYSEKTPYARIVKELQKPGYLVKITQKTIEYDKKKFNRMGYPPHYVKQK
ncbi:MAG: RHS repeat-associated core domain-containing protein, partial [Chitinophagaceae bacterium]